MELSKLQKTIIEAPEDKVVVVSRAAVGKTRCLTERIRYWLHQGIEPSDICAITFTNAAANEMQTRLAEDYKEGMFIGTIHSLAAHFLTDAGQGALVGSAANNDNFDLFFQYIKKIPNAVEHYSYVLVDEAQDLSENEYYFIFNMIRPEHFFVVGDPFQCIYERMKHASAKYMNELSKKDGVATYNLNENYRNKANILRYAQNSLSRLKVKDNSIPMSIGGTVYEGKFDAERLIRWINENKNYKDWAVLCYTNADVNYIIKLLENNDIPSIEFNQRKKTKKEIDDLINSNAVKVATIWCAKGLGFPNVVVYGHNWLANSKKPSEKRESIRVDYVAYTRAMDALMICK